MVLENVCFTSTPSRFSVCHVIIKPRDRPIVPATPGDVQSTRQTECETRPLEGLLVKALASAEIKISQVTTSTGQVQHVRGVDVRYLQQGGGMAA